MNIAPADADVFDPAAYVGQTHVTPPEREALAKLEGLGLHDVVRDRWPSEQVFSYWDYRAGMFHQNLGMRIDLVLASDPVAPRVRAAWVDRQARKGTGPSDHAPVIVDLDEAPDGDIGPMVPPPSARRPKRPVKLPQSSVVAGRSGADHQLVELEAEPGLAAARAELAAQHRPPL
jgi:exodeoxyribonuclease-3